jgi:hypothetical protein
MNTSIAKTKTGWQGNTRIDLGNDMVLRITTMKGVVQGGVVTDAVVHRVERVQGYAMETYTLRDFHKRLIHWNMSATEKRVRSQHQLALDMLDQIKAEIERHYAK